MQGLDPGVKYQKKCLCTVRDASTAGSRESASHCVYLYSHHDIQDSIFRFFASTNPCLCSDRQTAVSQSPPRKLTHPSSREGAVLTHFSTRACPWLSRIQKWWTAGSRPAHRGASQYRHAVTLCDVPETSARAVRGTALSGCCEVHAVRSHDRGSRRDMRTPSATEMTRRCSTVDVAGVAEGV